MNWLKLAQILARRARRAPHGVKVVAMFLLGLLSLRFGFAAGAWFCFAFAAVFALPLLRGITRPEPLDPAVTALFEATAGVTGAPREEVDRTTRPFSRRPVDPREWVAIDGGGSIELGLPLSTEATPERLGRLRAQVERITGRPMSLDANSRPGVVRLVPEMPLPVRVEFAPSNAAGLAYGADASGVATWDVEKAPHGLVSGATGSGKTVAMRCLIASALRKSWSVVACDPKRIELGWLRDRAGCSVDSFFDGMAQAIHDVRVEMMRRFDLIESGQPFNGNRILLVVDEATSLLAQAKADKNAAVLADLGEIARLGRRARVHLLIGMQRPDAGGDAGLPGELKRNLDFRLAVGPHDATASRMVLDSDDATRTAPVSGRAMARTLGVVSPVQVAWLADPNDLDASEADRRRAESLLPPRPARVPAGADLARLNDDADDQAASLSLIKPTGTTRRVRRTA